MPWTKEQRAKVFAEADFRNAAARKAAKVFREEMGKKRFVGREKNRAVEAFAKMLNARD